MRGAQYKCSVLYGMCIEHWILCIKIGIRCSLKRLGEVSIVRCIRNRIENAILTRQMQTVCMHKHKSKWYVDGKPKQVFKREAELKEYEKKKPLLTANNVCMRQTSDQQKYIHEHIEKTRLANRICSNNSNNNSNIKTGNIQTIRIQEVI